MFLWTGQCVGDGGARHLDLGDAFVELGKLALVEFSPGTGIIGTSGDKRLGFAQREANISQEQDQSDQSHCRNQVPPLA